MSDVRPVRRALLTVYDKTGVVELGSAARRDGCDARVLRRNGAGAPRRGSARDLGRGGHGVPRDARRSGEDAASEDPRGAAGRSTQGRTRRRAGRARHRAVRSPGLEPVPVPRDGGERRRPRGGHREDRHRRSGHGARGGEELRVRRRGGRSGSLRRDRRRDRARGRPDPRDATRLGGRGVRAHRRLRRGRGGMVRPAGCRRLVAGVRRGGVREGRRSPLRGEPAPAWSAVRRGRRAGRARWSEGACRARRCRSTTGSTSMPPTRWRRRCPRTPR